MSGIPIYTSSPINSTAASNPAGVTPQTSLPSQADPQHPTPSSNVAGPTTATAPTQSTSYAPAQPGAGVQAPTRPTPAPTAPIPTSTRNIATQDGPPPPQPGAVPVPRSTGSVAGRPSIPPPPKAGEPVQRPEFYAPDPTYAPTQPIPQTMPPQLHQQLPNPTRAQPPAAFTSPMETGRMSLEHPPGYHQNPNAGADNTTNPSVRPLEGLGGGGLGSSVLDDEPGVWDAAKKWASDAAGKVAEVEKEVWKRINGEQ